MENLKIINQDGKLLVDSREVALMTGKRHSDLLESIEGYIRYLENGNFRSQEFFIESSYITEGNNKTYKCFFLTRKGCDMVANKMTGEKGVLFTATYVTKFEEMENSLKIKLFKLPSSYADALRELAASVEQKEQLQTENKLLQQVVADYEPKVTYYDTILSSQEAVNINVIANDYGLTAQALNNILHDEKVQYKESKVWLLYSDYRGQGYTKSHTFIDTTGEARIHTKWTQKGRILIHKILELRGIKPLMDIEN